MDGLLVIDKPVGPTSHDVVARVRQATGEPRVGHTGTLDPAASGVLPLLLGRATRLARFLSGADKVYDATVILGTATDTYDAVGQPSGAPHAGPFPAREAIDRALDEFRGTFLQQPPAFSAKKVDGRRSYKNARARRRAPSEGERVEATALPAPVPVTAHAIELVDVDGARLTLRVHCSAGFYVRSLAHDLGHRLGTGAHLASLRRTRSGDADVAHAVALAAIERDPAEATRALVPLSRMLPELTSVVLTEEGARRVAHGRDLGPRDAAVSPGAAGSFVRLLDARGELLGIATPAVGLLHPFVVLK